MLVHTSMRRRIWLKSKRGVIRLLSSHLSEGVYFVWEYENEIVISSLHVSREGRLGVNLDEVGIDYLISRGATL